MPTRNPRFKQQDAIYKQLQYKKLTRDEEVAAWKAKDYESLFLSCIAMVRRIAKPFIRRTDPSMHDDIIAAGEMGLFEAVQKFDGSMGFRLTTYAYRVIRWRIAYEVRKQTKQIGKSLRYSELGEFIDCDSRDRSGIGGGSRPDLQFCDDDDEAKRIYQEAKAILDEREIDILLCRVNGMRLTEIGAKYGISKERVRQILENSVKTVRKRLIYLGVEINHDAPIDFPKCERTRSESGL